MIAGHIAAASERRAGETAHQSLAAAAIDEADSLGRERPAQSLGGVERTGRRCPALDPQ